MEVDRPDLAPSSASEVLLKLNAVLANQEAIVSQLHRIDLRLQRLETRSTGPSSSAGSDTYPTQRNRMSPRRPLLSIRNPLCPPVCDSARSPTKALESDPFSVRRAQGEEEGDAGRRHPLESQQAMVPDQGGNTVSSNTASPNITCTKSPPRVEINVGANRLEVPPSQQVSQQFFKANGQIRHAPGIVAFLFVVFGLICQVFL